MKNKNNIHFLLLEIMMNELKNKNELQIAITILENSEKINHIDIKTLAQLSNSSTAGISRFIKKFPVRSYKEFVHKCVNDFNDLSYAKIMHKQILQNNFLQQITYNKYLKAKQNIFDTSNNIDLDDLNQLLQIIKKSRSITIIGANHSLEIFSKLQKELILHGIPTYMYKQKNKLNIHLNSLSKEDCLLFVSVEGRYQKAYGDDILQLAKKKELTTILITQSKRIIIKDYHKIIYYGRDIDVNMGYFSLLFLVDVLVDMLKYKNFIK